VTTPSLDTVFAHTDLFHDHLDGCERCASRPFDLCAEGAKLLKAAGDLAQKLKGTCDCGRAWKSSAANPYGHAVDCPAHPTFAKGAVSQ
jgi:hypothetical protein